MDCILCKSPEMFIVAADICFCPGCGNYKLVPDCSQLLNDPQVAFKVASWVSLQNTFGITPEITPEIVAQNRSSKIPSVAKRAELYLGAVLKSFPGNLAGSFVINSPKYRVASWCYHSADCIAIADYLRQIGAFEPPFPPLAGYMTLVAKGHLIYEQMVGERASSSQAFVAMHFSEARRPAFDDGIAKAVAGAGYDPVRVDRVEHDGKIDDRIVAEIRRSAFVIADFTGHRGGVYYEAGFAHGLSRPVIFTCQKKHLTKLHFDVRQYNTIPWDTPASLVAPLQNRILALFGAGPLRPDAKPITEDAASIP